MLRSSFAGRKAATSASQRWLPSSPTINLLNASQSTVRGLAWQRYSKQTPLRDVAPALNGRANLARVRPCRTGAASFMVARARGRARRRASSAAGGQIGNTGTIRGKPRRNDRACERHYLRSAICATRSKGPGTAGQSISLASMPMARSRGLPREAGSRELTARLRAYGSAHFRPGYQLLRLTLERKESIAICNGRRSS
jgi:hypothetical protein